MASGSARLGSVFHFSARIGSIGLGSDRLGEARPVPARLGSARARSGSARLGSARETCPGDLPGRPAREACPGLPSYWAPFDRSAYYETKKTLPYILLLTT